MAKSSNQKLKLMYLLKILEEKTDMDHGLTMPQLIEELGRYDVKAERKSIYDDIEFFKDKLVLRPSEISNHPAVARLVAMGCEPFGSPTMSNQAVMPFPTLKIGPGDSARSHTADEFIYVDEIADAIELYWKLLDGLELNISK